MTNIDRIQNALAWQAEASNRSISIEVGKTFKPFSIWAYDYDLMTGAYVEDDTEINLEATHAAKELEELAKLKAKYEGAA